MNNLTIEQQRKYTIKHAGKVNITKDLYMLEHMDQNLAYRSAAARLGSDAERADLLKTMKERYSWYRKGWRQFPAEAIAAKHGADYVRKTGHPPLSVDIETAALCNLACQFCFRQWITTPDKIMSDELAFKVIDQVAELGAPSIKFNWRGEPTLHARLPEFIRYAKEKGILETIINTNVTKLTDKFAHQLIDAGLDVMIYSFDGGTEETYNKYRIGRFEENQFKDVYASITRFAEIRRERGAHFPFTKIQMILTKETFPEVDSFYGLFARSVDEVSTGAYMERGGNYEVLADEEKSRILKHLPEGTRPETLQFWKDLDGNLYLETGRIACEQVFQRLMVSYDGRVFMCCYDWGNEHPVGYVSDESFKNGDADYEHVMEHFHEKKKGFEMMDLAMPSRDVHIEKKVESLREIWGGPELSKVRDLHVNGHIKDVAICEKCTFKETFTWQKVD